MAGLQFNKGKNNKGSDRKLCYRHSKPSAHSLGQVSPGLGMKTLNPTVV